MSRSEATIFVRDALGKEGVAIREVGDSEAYVSRAASMRSSNHSSMETGYD
jgi:hypothetical protein